MLTFKFFFHKINIIDVFSFLFLLKSQNWSQCYKLFYNKAIKCIIYMKNICMIVYNYKHSMENVINWWCKMCPQLFGAATFIASCFRRWPLKNI